MAQSTVLRRVVVGSIQLAAATCLVLWFTGGPGSNKIPGVEIDENPDDYKSSSVIEKFRYCSRQANQKTTNDKSFIVQYTNCIKDTMPKIDFDKFRMGRFGEDKVFAPMKSSFDENTCKWVTVGIGGDTQVEKLFQQKYPGCKIFGVEASEDQYLDFENYGTVIPFGVGVESAAFNLTIRKETKYLEKEVKVLAMSELLDKYIGTRKIHYMTIDIEGFEYVILEALIGGKPLSEQGVVFCQIDAELHHQKGKITHLKNFLEKFDSDDSDYLPIFTTKFITHQKVTFLNFKDPECEKAFNVELFV